MSLIAAVTQIPELRKRLFITFGLLAVYRLGVVVSVPGIDIAKLKAMFESSGGGLYGIINMFSGGALENFSLFTLGIAPYISVSIIIQLLTPSIPALEQLKKEGDAGRRVLTRYTRIGTICLALVQGYLIALGLENQNLTFTSGISFRLLTAITLTAGTSFIMWLGEQITERGLGNGVSIIIFAGIVARMPTVLISTLALAQSGEVSAWAILGVLLFCFASVALIVFVERSVRKLPIQYPKKRLAVGGGVKGQQAMLSDHGGPLGQFLPLKVNMAGVIPPIFASAVLVLPTYLLGFTTNEFLLDLLQSFKPGDSPYELFFAGLILLFSFFYTALIFNPEEVAENLKKNGGFIPSVRPGKETADFIFAVLNRLTFWGALYIAAICIIPQFVYVAAGVQDFAFVFGGTAILIVVGVTLDTDSQVESFMINQSYEKVLNRVKSGALTPSFRGGGKRSRILRR